VVSFTPWPLKPEERALVAHYVGGWVVPGAGLDAVEKRKILCPCQETKPDHPARSPSLYRLKLSFPNITTDVVLVTAILTVIAVVVASGSNY
jgi:hypothetical protein